MNNFSQLLSKKRIMKSKTKARDCYDTKNVCGYIILHFLYVRQLIYHVKHSDCDTLRVPAVGHPCQILEIHGFERSPPNKSQNTD
jgi:hypothetical protein